jgi:hypothetical protein
MTAAENEDIVLITVQKNACSEIITVELAE